MDLARRQLDGWRVEGEDVAGRVVQDDARRVPTRDVARGASPANDHRARDDLDGVVAVRDDLGVREPLIDAQHLVRGRERTDPAEREREAMRAREGGYGRGNGRL